MFLEQSHLARRTDHQGRFGTSAPPLLQNCSADLRNCSAQVMRARMRAGECDPILFSALYVRVRSPMPTAGLSLCIRLNEMVAAAANLGK